MGNIGENYRTRKGNMVMKKKLQTKLDWEKIREEEGIRIKHLRLNGKLVGTVVYKEEEGDTVSYGTSFPGKFQKIPGENKARVIG